MEYKRFEDTIILRLDPGDDIIESIKNLISKENIKLGYLMGLGAVNKAEIGLYSLEEKKYYSNIYEGDFEISNLHGNISTMDGEHYLHCHILISDINQKTFGGHLNSAYISATGEIMIKIINGEVDREVSPDTGLNILKF